MEYVSDPITETANAVDTKLGTLKAVGKKLVVCQELLQFFKELGRAGVGTRSLESKAAKIVGERNSKNLIGGGTQT